MTSISENSPVMMPGVSAEISDDRNNGPLPVLVPSYHFLITWFSNSCLFDPSISFVRQCRFYEGLVFVCLETWSRLILFDLFLCLCVYICVCACMYIFLHFQSWSALGVSDGIAEKSLELESEFLTRNLCFANH